ncbi:hypothetical protein AAHC03_01230 [Spirometra sp. Aus1]
MGSHGVGKSAIARRFLKNSFSESYQPTVEETYSTVLQTLTGSCIRLVLTDTAGLHHFPAMRELRMRTGDAFLLVFSFDSQESFQEALRLHKKLKQVRGDLFDDQAVIFVGNKLDLLLWPSTGSNPPQNVRPEKDVHQKGLRVNGGMSVAQTAAAIYQQAESTLSQKPSSRYITTSARIGHNVLELYHLILWPILHASAQPKSNQDTRKPGFSEDGMARRKISAVKFAPKRVVWPWKQISSMRIPFEIHFPLRQRIPSAELTEEDNVSVDDIRVVCVGASETDDFHGAPLQTKTGFRRRFSIGQRLFPAISSKHRRKQSECTMRKPAARSTSVDNSALKKIQSHDAIKDLTTTCSNFDENSINSTSFHCLTEGGDISLRSASFCSDVSFASGNSKYGQFLSPGLISGGSSMRGSMEIPTQALDFVKEVGRLLDPSNKSVNAAEFRIPHTALMSRQQKSPGSAWERVRKKGVFQ